MRRFFKSGPIKKHSEVANFISSPSIQEWEELCRAAIEFKEMGTWSWMWGSDIFG